MAKATHLYRCTNPACLENGAPYEFESAEATCPKCQVAQNHPKFGSIITRLVKVHFDPPAEIAGFGMGHRACDPSKSIQTPVDALGRPQIGHAGTGLAVAVTCRQCRATPAWRKAMDLIDAEDTDSADQTLRGSLGRIQAVGKVNKSKD